MPQIAYRTVRSRRKFAEAPKVRLMLADAMRAEVAPHYTKEFKKVIANWEHKPEFKTRFFTHNPDIIKVDIRPVGVNKKYWIWTSRGTKRHDIPVGDKGYLAFQLGYKPKTKYRGQYGGPGKATGEWVRTTKTIDHPGTKARESEEVIAEEELPWFRRTMENIWRRTIRAL